MVIHIPDGAETAKPIPSLNLIRVFIYSPNLFYVQIGYSHTRPSRSGAGQVTRITQKIAIPKEKGYESPRWVVWAKRRESGWSGWEKYHIQFYINNSKEYHIWRFSISIERERNISYTILFVFLWLFFFKFLYVFTLFL